LIDLTGESVKPDVTDAKLFFLIMESCPAFQPGADTNDDGRKNECCNATGDEQVRLLAGASMLPDFTIKYREDC
jgi:hypothetical protein